MQRAPEWPAHVRTAGPRGYRPLPRNLETPLPRKESFTRSKTVLPTVPDFRLMPPWKMLREVQLPLVGFVGRR